MIKIGSKEFKTKKALKEYVQAQMYKVKKGEPLKGIHLKVVDYIFRQHENYEEKIKDMDYTISVRTSSGMNKQYREHYIIREDGTETDFSYVKAIAGKTCKISDIKRALRAVILPQQFAAKNNYFEKHQDSQGYVVCPVTNLKVKKKETHTDHFPVKFEKIVADWFADRSLNSESFVLLDGGDNSVNMLVEDKVLEEDFCKYHETHAQYRIVLAKVNLQAARGKREEF